MREIHNSIDTPPRFWTRRRARNALAVATAAILVATVGLVALVADAAPRELGQVDWLRSYSAAQQQSTATGKPVFLLFQEVPGCQTCVSFGEEVLSHPLLVEAIEDEFIPVAIHNNKGGSDRETLNQFDEQSWNNPVVRFTSAQGEDLIPRRAGVWKPAEIIDRMILALEAGSRTVPAYLRKLRTEMSPNRVEHATLSMHCFWEGEACLGALPGLLSSRAGHLGGREVVEVRFDPSRTPYSEVVQSANRLGCSDGVFAHDDEQLKIAQRIFGKGARLSSRFARNASDRDQKFHLKQRGLLPVERLTEAQATQLNHAAWAKSADYPAMSPRQKSALTR